MKLNIGKPEFAFLSGVLGAIVSVIIHFLIEYRQFPFLRGPTVLSGGTYVPTEEFVEFASPLFIYAVPAFIFVGLINYFILKKRQ